MSKIHCTYHTQFEPYCSACCHAREAAKREAEEMPRSFSSFSLVTEEEKWGEKTRERSREH